MPRCNALRRKRRRSSRSARRQTVAERPRLEWFDAIEFRSWPRCSIASHARWTFQPGLPQTEVPHLFSKETFMLRGGPTEEDSGSRSSKSGDVGDAAKQPCRTARACSLADPWERSRQPLTGFALPSVKGLFFGSFSCRIAAPR